MSERKSNIQLLFCTSTLLASLLWLCDAELQLAYEFRIPALLSLKSKTPDCRGLPNGLYPDLRSIVPCSHYFKCQNGEMVRLSACPRGSYFSLRVREGCGPKHLSACQSISTPSLHSNRRQMSTSKVSQDARTLLQLKKFVTQDPYLDVYGWSSSTSVCSWNAITCEKNQVAEISFSSISFTSLSDIIPIFAQIRSLKKLYLSSANLTGYIPSSIGSLSQLQLLWLDGNQLQSPLPSEFSKLYNLKELVLAGNPLSEFPSVVFSMTNLTALDLSSTKLSDSIPQELFSLTKLQSLNLGDNSLKGSLPPNICTFSDMQTLDLSSNQFTGSIPETIGGCSKSIDLSGNFLSGRIPEKSLCQGKTLSELYLRKNSLSGNLSDTLGDCPLTNLVLSSNQLTGGVNGKLISKLASTIQGLDLSNNPLGGSLPSAITNASQLTFLGLSNASLSGSIPVNIGNLTSLFILYLDDNDLSGTIPSSISQLTFLTDVGLSKNRLSGSVNIDWTNFAMLSWIDLHKNQLSGPFPLSLTELTGIQNLFLQENRFNGSIPSSLGRLTSLLSLNLSSNAFTGSIPSSLGNLILLNNLDLSQNQLNGSIPAALQKLNSELTGLVLNNNKLSGSFPEWLGTFSNLTSLHLENNEFSGFLPSLDIPLLLDLNVSNNSFNGSIPMFHGSNSVQFLDLSYNAFFGYIPSWMYTNNNLLGLRLSHNQLSGSLSSDVENLYSLLVLDLSDNDISGNIPSSISNLTQLTTLNLKGNAFDGEIPSQIGSLTSLVSLDFSDNKFSGKLPHSLFFLKSLKFFNISGNKVVGSIPQGMNRFNRSSFLDTSLCGTPLKSCDSSDLVLIIGIIVGCTLTLTVLFFIFFLLFYMRRRYKGVEEEGEFLFFEKFPCAVDYYNILKSTHNFDDKYKLGSGGFGAVYIAKFGDGHLELAVKRLMETARRDEEFKAEIKTLGQIRHKNLVTLLGAYLHPSSHEILLLYNYLKGGNLDSYLSGSKSGKDGVFSSWAVRHRIALGSAKGFKYLHHECDPPIVHRDIKPANILIDENMEAYVGDFGLAKVMDTNETHLSTSVLGTIGYFAPEYTQRGHLYLKSDVFSFGIVLLQMITGKRPTSPEIAEAGGLALWVARNSPESVVDSNLELEEDEMEEVLACLKLGLLCTAKKPADRPTMANVVQVLENLSLFAEEIESSMANATPSSVSSFPWAVRSEGGANSSSLSDFDQHHYSQ